MSKTVLVIGDTHLPFEHKDYLAFCQRIHKAFKCTDVVHIGDLVDNHSISYHEHDPNGLSPEDEMKVVDEKLAKNAVKTAFKANWGDMLEQGAGGYGSQLLETMAGGKCDYILLVVDWTD